MVKLCYRQDDFYFEQISVHDKPEGTIHKFNQTAGDAQSKAISLTAACDVAAYKAFHQLVCVDIQSSARDVFDGEDDLFVALDGIEIHPCVRKGIFTDVAEQVI